MSEVNEEAIKEKLRAAAALHGFLARRLNQLKSLSDMMVSEIGEAGVQFNLSHKALLEAMQLAGINLEQPTQSE